MNRLNILFGRKKIAVIFAVIVVLILLLVFWYFKSTKQEELNDQFYTEIYTAAADIPSGTEISGDMLKVQKIPGEMYSDKYFTDEKEISGKKSHKDIKKGEIISTDKLEGGTAQQKSYIKFSSCIPQGCRAITVPVNYYGECSLIEAGDKVDIISTYYDDKTGEFITSTVLQFKEIIRMGGGLTGEKENFETSRDGTDGSVFGDLFSEESSSQSNLLTMTFYLTPEEAEKIILSLQIGTLNLAICPG